MNTADGWYTKEMNDGVNILVFGANESGIHGAGAAKDAYDNWGAVWEAVGRTGQSYGIPTKDFELETLPLSEIKDYVDEFIEYAKANKKHTFLVTRIGCGLAGYQDAYIAHMFSGAPENCVLPDGWRDFN